MKRSLATTFITLSFLAGCEKPPVANPPKDAANSDILYDFYWERDSKEPTRYVSSEKNGSTAYLFNFAAPAGTKIGVDKKYRLHYIGTWPLKNCYETRTVRTPGIKGIGHSSARDVPRQSRARD